MTAVRGCPLPAERWRPPPPSVRAGEQVAERPARLGTAGSSSKLLTVEARAPDDTARGTFFDFAQNERTEERTFTPTRRTVLTGLAATLAAPAHAAADDPAAPDSVTAALDSAGKAERPDDALATLAPFDPERLPPARRLDLLTARAGLAIDARLALNPDDYSLRLQRVLGPADPDAAERRLAAELDRLHARALPLFARLGLTQGSVGDRYQRLWRDERWLYTSPDAAVADMARMLAAARARVPAAFGQLPAWTLDCAVRALTPDEIAAGKNGYRVVPAPGRPGSYVVDLKALRRRPSWTLPSVVAHELLPGHMIQLGLESAEPPHPLRLTYAAPFVEGWGIYAEALAAGEGAYATPEAMLGHLHWLLFRVGRGLVDLRIHRRGWSQEQARAALEQWQGEPAYFAPYETELPRIVREPASRAAEALAWLSISDRAPRAAPARRRFHARILTHGRKRIDML